MFGEVQYLKLSQRIVTFSLSWCILGTHGNQLVDAVSHRSE